MDIERGVVWPVAMRFGPEEALVAEGAVELIESVQEFNLILGWSERGGRRRKRRVVWRR